MAERPIEAIICILSDAAGIQDDDVGLFDVVCPRHPARDEIRSDANGVVFIHLASEGSDNELAWHSDEVRRLQPWTGHSGYRLQREDRRARVNGGGHPDRYRKR